MYEKTQEVDAFKRRSSLFCYDWASGLVSPWRPAPQSSILAALDGINAACPEPLSSHSLVIDLGCGSASLLDAPAVSETASALFL